MSLTPFCMIKQFPRNLVLILLLGGGISHAEETLKIYLIGNSLTMSTTLDRVHELAAEQGVDLQYGSQLSGGKSLIRHLNYKDEPNQKWKSWETNVPNGDTFDPDENMYVDAPGELHRFGLYDEALAGHDWDKVVFQLYGGSLHDDLKAISTYVQLATSKGNDPEFLIYSVWPRRPKERLDDGSIAVLNLDYPEEWASDYTASAEDTSKTAGLYYYSRDYVETLLKELRSRFPDQSIGLIPVGEVFLELDRKIKAGELPGIQALAEHQPDLLPGIDEDTSFDDGANVFYADGHHLNPMPHQMDSLGIFVSGTSVTTGVIKRSPVGLSGEPYGLDDEKDATLILAIQETILDVFQNTPGTGF